MNNIDKTSNNAANDNIPMLHLKEGCCIKLLKALPDCSVDLILADLPYNITPLAIDKKIDLAAVWRQFRRVLTPTGAIVCFAVQPFTTDLINEGRDWFKYSRVWEKNKATGFANAKNSPMRIHEDLLVFSPGTAIQASRSARRMTYNPQGVVSCGMKVMRPRRSIRYLGKVLGSVKARTYEAFTNYPTSIMRYAKDRQRSRFHHPFAKPVALLEELIMTYSNVGDVVLDPTMGSGSTGVAAINTKREFVGMEQDRAFYELASERLFEAVTAKSAVNDNHWSEHEAA